jgi:hypothetical protein
MKKTCDCVCHKLGYTYCDCPTHAAFDARKDDAK